MTKADRIAEPVMLWMFCALLVVIWHVHPASDVWIAAAAWSLGLLLVGVAVGEHR